MQPIMCYVVHITWNQNKFRSHVTSFYSRGTVKFQYHSTWDQTIV